jgi:triosephosphate isomerase
VAGNWKMNLLAAPAAQLAAEVATAAADVAGPDVAVFPTYTALHAVRTALAGSRVILGAQACHPAAGGAHTGEIAASMLVDAGCAAVLCGHSERRAAGETDDEVGRRASAGLAAGLRVVVCVGETLAEREAGSTETVVVRQLEAALAGVEDLALVDLAYEPVWAIGTGRTATPEIAAAVHAVLRNRMVEKFGDAGREPRILYGGSAKPGNARSLLSAADVGGLLVGGASLDGASFRAIIEAAVPV